MVELETARVVRPFSFPNTYQAVRGTVADLNRASSLQELYDITARAVRALTGFDRVMVYRYDADYNGEVVAEAKRADLNSFLGLHYPASDIPAQARALYEKNWIRLISDVDYAPAPIEPADHPATGAPLDLTYSTLRSVSPIHLEYLRNMGVRASMSISLLRDDKLWGLIACHHYAGPHAPPFAPARPRSSSARRCRCGWSTGRRRTRCTGRCRSRSPRWPGSPPRPSTRTAR